MIRIFVGIVLVLLSLPASSAAQQLAVDYAAVPTPAWLTQSDRDLWDQLVYDAYDDQHHELIGLPDLADRRTLVLWHQDLRTFDVCWELSSQSYAAERLAPYANANWWETQIERWTGLDWQGDFDTSCGVGLFGSGQVNVRTAELDGTVLALTMRFPKSGRWRNSTINFDAEGMRRAEDYQLEWAMVHELGHVLGLHHVEPGSGFVMEPRVPRSPRMQPAKEIDMARLAYEVRAGTVYPGLEDATPVPALPLMAVVLLAQLLSGVIRRTAR